ncbi:MAG: tetratricopeptide repeat protein [Coriobacteriaceae bacterium]|nr:tetratricopeptide repeat protein [Coriobacteriaceae bacterium]
MPEASIIKLPLLSRRRRLPRLVGQPEGTSYGIVQRSCPEPASSRGYVVEHLPRSRARLLACITDDGRVFRVDGPLTALPDRTADLSIATEDRPDRGGIFVQDDIGRPRRVGSFTGTASGLLTAEGDDALPGQRGLPYRDFLAVLYLRFFVFADTAPAEGDENEGAEDATIRASIDLEPLDDPVELFEGFRSLPLADAIETLLFRISAKEDPSGIERYAQRLLAPFDLDRLREITLRGEVGLARIERTDSFYIIFDRKGSDDSDMAFMLAIETAMNRLSRILDFLGAGLEPLSSSPTEAGCSLIDQRVLRGAGSQAPAVFSLAQQPNAWSNPGSVTCEPGGEWDVRTRMAHLLEGLDLTASLECIFRYDASRHAIGIEFAAPTAACLPREVYDARAGAWRAIEAEVAADMAEELSCRMALALAAAGFAAGLAIRRCTVRMRPLDGGAPRSLAFSRAPFLASQLGLARSLDRRGLASRFLASSLQACAVSEDDEANEIFRQPDRGPYVDPRHDHRALPVALRDMLLADTADELEVMEPDDDPHMLRLARLREVAARDLEEAAEGLLTMIEELQASCAAAEALSDRPVVSRYADGYFARMLMGLDEEDRDRRILRVPDALYYAQLEVATMLSRSERFEEAVIETRRLLDMAPTSSGAHFALINALARLERYDEVIEVARHGLACAFERDAAEYFFYRMAFAYWHRGDRETGLACYRMVPARSGLGEAARMEMRRLMAEMGRAEEPSEAWARERLSLMEISAPPTDRVLRFLSDAAVRLCDAGFLFLAARCCFEMWRVRNDDEIGMVCKSLNW